MSDRRTRVPLARSCSPTTVRRSRRPTAVLALLSVGLVATGAAWSLAAPAAAAAATVELGTASSFAVLAGSAVTNTGASVIEGDLGVSPGTAVSGFPPGTVVNGTTHVNDGVALQAQDDVTTAYNDAAGRSTTVDVTGSDLGGMTLTSGVYEHTSGMQLTGTVTLDAQGDPNAVFIFQAGSTLTTASNSSVSLINGASPCNVFWQVGSSATLGTGTDFVGTIMALTSATLTTGAEVEGRVLARNGQVSLDTNLITAPGCAAPPTTTPTTTPTDTPTGTPTTTPGTPTTTPGTTTGTPGTDTPTTPAPTDGSPTDGSTPGGSTPGGSTPGGVTTQETPGPEGDTPGGGTPDEDRPTPLIPEGNPDTGLGGASRPSGAPTSP